MKGSRPIGIVHRGEMVGEMGALLGEKRSAGVLTMQESMLYEGHPRVLRNLPPRIIYPFMIYVFSITAKRLRAADRRLAVP
jgi:CRP-like cAMP-binding protein